jgi:hypothetical protein
VPAVSLLSPSLKPVGASDFTLTLTGSGFYPESVVRLNGSDRTTTYVNETQLTASISAADVSTTGTAVVTVFNPTPGGGESTAVIFPVISFTPWKGDVLTTSKVTFDWDDIIDAELYKIQLSEKQDFSTLVFSIKTTESTYSYDSFLKYSSTYYWRIKVKTDDTWGAWSPVWKFYSMDPLAPPMLLDPTHKAFLNDSSMSLTWEPVVNAAEYKVQVSKDPLFTTKLVKEKISMLTLTPSYVFTDGKYYWRVRAIDASGGKGPWSEVHIFKVVTP